MKNITKAQDIATTFNTAEELADLYTVKELRGFAEQLGHDASGLKKSHLAGKVLEWSRQSVSEPCEPIVMEELVGTITPSEPIGYPTPGLDGEIAKEYLETLNDQRFSWPYRCELLIGILEKSSWDGSFPAGFLEDPSKLAHLDLQARAAVLGVSKGGNKTILCEKLKSPSEHQAKSKVGVSGPYSGAKTRVPVGHLTGVYSVTPNMANRLLNDMERDMEGVRGLTHQQFVKRYSAKPMASFIGVHLISDEDADWATVEISRQQLADDITKLG